MTKSQELLAKAKRYMAGGVMHHLYPLPDEVNTVIARGEGSHIWDVDGKEYIDYQMGSGPLILGHAHPAILEAVHRRADEGSQFYQLTQPAIELAEMVVNAVPCAEKLKYAGSGTEATFISLRLARAFTGKSVIMKFEGGYHGTHDYTVWGTRHRQPMEYPYGEADSLGIPPVLREEVLIAPFNDIDTTASLIRQHKDELAAVIVEPFFRNIRPKPGFLQGLREVTRESDVVLIFDEVVTGFRLGWGGAQEFYGVVPDISTHGKAIGGGYPIGAIVGGDDLMASLEPGRVASGDFVMYSGTFSGNPVSTSAGIAALQELRKPGTYQRLHGNGESLANGLKELSQMLEVPMYVVSEGSILCYLFTDKAPENYRDTWAADGGKLKRFSLELTKRGVWAPGGKWYVSAAHTKEDIGETLDAAEAALRVVMG